MTRIDTHNMVCDFGRHKGELYTRLPVQYLKWMVNSEHSRKDIAQAELTRRGTTTPDLEVSGHAMDRASLYCRQIWHTTKKHENEGLYSWLVRMATEALARGEKDGKGKLIAYGMKFAFTADGCWPVLKTVMPIKRSRSLVVPFMLLLFASPAFAQCPEVCGKGQDGREYCTRRCFPEGSVYERPYLRPFDGLYEPKEPSDDWEKPAYQPKDPVVIPRQKLLYDWGKYEYD